MDATPSAYQFGGCGRVGGDLALFLRAFWEPRRGQSGDVRTCLMRAVMLTFAATQTLTLTVRPQ